MTHHITQIPPNQVILIRGEGNYTWVHLANGHQLLSARTVKHYEHHFSAYHFIRIHRAYLVNPQHIVGFGQLVLLSNGMRLKPSRRKKDQVRKGLRQIGSQESLIA